MNIVIWIFDNVMSWIGTWFTAMTVILLVVTITYIFREKDFSYYGIVESARDDFSIIISLVPMCIVALMAIITVGISRIPLLIRKIRKKIDFIRFH